MVSINSFSPLGGAVPTQASPMDELWRSQTDSSKRQKPAEPVIGSLLDETTGLILWLNEKRSSMVYLWQGSMISCAVKVSNHAFDVKIRILSGTGQMLTVVNG